MARPTKSNGRANRHPFLALVVDDEEAGHLLLQQRFRKELKSRLVAFHFVRSGEDALAYLRDHDLPDVVLLLSDLDLSRLPALRLLQKIKEDFEAVPVYMATSNGSPQHYRTALEYGVQGYQIKPIDFKRLRREVFGVRMP